MARSPFIRHQHRVGITRRELLQVGYSGLLGVGLPSALAGRTLGSDADRGVQSLPAKPKQVLIIFLTGAPVIMIRST